MWWAYNLKEKKKVIKENFSLVCEGSGNVVHFVCALKREPHKLVLPYLFSTPSFRLLFTTTLSSSPLPHSFPSSSLTPHSFTSLPLTNNCAKSHSTFEYSLHYFKSTFKKASPKKRRKKKEKKKGIFLNIYLEKIYLKKAVFNVEELYWMVKREKKGVDGNFSLSILRWF